MGKWFSRSPKDLTSFFRGTDELAAADELPAAGVLAGLTSFLATNVAGMMGVAS